MQIIENVLDHVTIGEAKTFRSLTMFPLLNGANHETGYQTLDEALAKGLAHVTEVSEGGSVPELKFRNDSNGRILLLDGEELVGAKQNRVLNLTLLVEAHQDLKIPVSCVEAGRWTHQSAEFSTSEHTHYATGRAKKMAQVNMAMEESGGTARHSNQSEVWADISAKSMRMAAHSPTQAMSDVYETHSTSVEDYVGQFPTLPEQVGAVFAINGEVIGFDLFDQPSTLQKLLPKLVRSYALDALESPEDPTKTAEIRTVQEMLQSVRQAKAETFPSLGVGEDIRLTGEGLAGGALAAEGRLIHLSAFRMAKEFDSEATMSPVPMNRVSQRRQFRQQ